MRFDCKSAARTVAIATCAVLLAACVRVTAGSQGHGNAWTRHGLLRIADLQEPDTLDPVVGNFQIDYDLAQLWGGFLFNYSDRNELVPELATVEPTLRNGGISRDGRTIVYHLRPGVRWQDGAPFDASDIVFTWHAVMDRNNNVPSTVGYDDIATIDVRDPHMIAVHLRRPFAPFVATFLTESTNPYSVLPAHLLARDPDLNRIAYNSEPVGTGPFIVARWRRGDKIVFRANPHYWRGPPKLREIWYTPVSDENTIATLLASHAADLEYRGAAANFGELRHIDGFDTVLTPFSEFSQIALNLRSRPLADVRVRRALWYAFDTAAAIRDVSHGVNAAGATDQPAFSWAYDARVARYSFDPAKARALLDAAGWISGSDGIRSKGGKRLSLVLASVAGDATENALAVVLQRNWHDVGVELQTKTYASSLYFSTYEAGGIVQSGKFDVALFNWSNGVDPDDSTEFACDQIPPHGQNVYGLCDPRIDAAERVALSTYDRSVRKSAYARIQSALAEDVPMIVVWYVRRIDVQNRDLKNYRPAHAVTSWWNPYDWSI